ncbi:hypothetical protein G6F50_016625 [Rhizopus delemar]|uniref:Uncharacterized protein n=1 Tax=Rhizopus delemar TaxID=936053 RepID=A0A9P7C1D9_9FUNG|nr:hypothetical protein G6F50_016625 [Rhizopus delemar]
MGATARRLARRNSHPTCSGVNNLACAVCASPVERSTVVSISTALRVAYCGDGLDLDHRGRVVQRLDLRDRVGRVGRREEAAAQRHHVLEMPHIGHEDGDLDHACSPWARKPPETILPSSAAPACPEMKSRFPYWMPCDSRKGS